MLASETQAIAEYLKQTILSHYNTPADKVSDRVADTRDTLCYATNDNQTAVAAMLDEQADLAIVIGGYNSSNTSHLVELCELKLPTYFINDEHCLESSDEIRHFNLHTHNEEAKVNYLPSGKPLRIMITSGASCPDALVERVIARLATLTGNDLNIESLVEEWSKVSV